ncbi:hypothetical protein BSKO_08087 [Bryopsis sp. KO-2023]|nr:hypothetical protein BSKO_08087 [Bryopsis sp. KO-2023]
MMKSGCGRPLQGRPSSIHSGHRSTNLIATLKPRILSMGGINPRRNGEAARRSTEARNTKATRRRNFLNSSILGGLFFGWWDAGKCEASTQPTQMTYQQLAQLIDEQMVLKVEFYRNETIAIVEIWTPEFDGVKRVRLDLQGPMGGEVLHLLKEKGVTFSVHSKDEENTTMLLGMILAFSFPILMVGGLLLASQRTRGQNSRNIFNMTKSGARIEMDPDTGVTFDDVAGMGEAKSDVMELVEFLKNPERYTNVGAKIPKGILMVGPPGTGKTLLAKAIAGEAKVPFFSISGSEFVEMFVGVGASRVRNLFSNAKKNSPCLLFIDEIDALGRARGGGGGGENGEREQALNQLLTEMDGFEGNDGVIVLGATNRDDILDRALLRPGRFDRQVRVEIPDVSGRLEILKVHARSKVFDQDVDLRHVAHRTVGFSGAEIANLLNEAAILAARRELKCISQFEIDDSIDRIAAGVAGTPLANGKSKSLIAYHEAGHAICGTLTHGHDAVQKVTLIPRGQARGLTWFVPGEDPSMVSKQQMFARIVGALGGRAAEEVIFGREEVTTGAASDLQMVTQMAKQMVMLYGMSGVGQRSLHSSSSQSEDVVMRLLARNEMSEQLKHEIDHAMMEIVAEAYQIGLRHIHQNREAIDHVVEVLLEKETLSGEEFRAILSKYAEVPDASFPSPALFP